MKPKISKQCESRFSHLEPAQLSQLIERADQLRKRSGAPATLLDTWIDRVIRADQRKLEQSSEHRPGVVSGVLGPSVLVDTPIGIVRADVLSQSPVAGDEVTVACLGGNHVVAAVAPRRTKLSRPNVDTGQEQVIVANVEIVVIVVSVGTPPLHPRLIDRYLVAIEQGGAAPAVFVNKLDLLEDPSELNCLEPYRAAGVPVFTGSVASDDGFEQLRQHLAGKACAFVGHSGVGKSSIVNRLKPDAHLDTGGVSEGYGRGTHTTTTSSRHCLADGTVLFDTPGIRSFGLYRLSKHDLAAAFPEFEDYSCKFNDCTHTHEPECGVLVGVSNGRIHRSRYDTYMRLLEELRE